MTSIKDTLDLIPEMEDESISSVDLMKNADYLRHSSTIISDALQKGCDVLQLENGDIVTTGTRIVVTRYRWDDEASKIVKVSAKERKQQEAQLKKKTDA